MSDFAVLLIHGLSGTPSEMGFLADYFKSKKIPVSCLTLPGHGTKPEDLHHITYADWLEAGTTAVDDLRMKHKKVVVIGFSLGSLVALHLSAHKDVYGLVTIAPPLLKPTWLLEKASAAIPKIAKVFPKFPFGSSPIFVSAESILPYEVISYPYVPTTTVAEVFKLIKHIKVSRLESQKPLFVAQGKWDPYTWLSDTPNHPGVIKKKYDSSSHLVPLDKDRQILADDIYQFIQGNI